MTLPSITILVVMMWASIHGTDKHMVTARSIVTEGHEQCEAQKADVLSAIKKNGATIGELKLDIIDMNAICLTFEPLRDANAKN